MSEQEDVPHLIIVFLPNGCIEVRHHRLEDYQEAALPDIMRVLADSWDNGDNEHTEH